MWPGSERLEFLYVTASYGPAPSWRGASEEDLQYAEDVHEQRPSSGYVGGTIECARLGQAAIERFDTAARLCCAPG